MAMRLVFLRLELKRAMKRLPQIYAGAIVLLFLAGTIAFLSGRLLYGDAVAGRVSVGVVLPEDDALTRQMMSMVSSLDSVKSLCDFQYVDRETGKEGLQKGELFALMEIPPEMIEGIMDGTNPPVQIRFPKGAGIESRIFRELTEAGSKTLGAAQAAVYAGDELCLNYGMEDAVHVAERDLNRILMDYSLPRSSYFRHAQVSAAGDISLPVFYGISVSVLFLLLLAVPVSSYLLPWSRAMKQKLALGGVGSKSRAAARIAGLAGLFLAVSVPVSAAAVWKGGLTPGWGSAAALFCVCLAAAAFVVALYQVAGTLLGGIMLLFLAVTGQHFLAGGFIPLVFLPEGLKGLAPFMPSTVLMDGVKMAVTGVRTAAGFGRLFLMAAGCFFVTLGMEARER